MLNVLLVADNAALCEQIRSAILLSGNLTAHNHEAEARSELEALAKLSASIGRCGPGDNDDDIHRNYELALKALLDTNLKLPGTGWNRQLIDCLNHVASMESLEQIGAAVKRLIDTIVAALNPPNRSSTHRTIQNALAVIQAKYNTSLTLESVAKEVYVSTTYLSALFKQELGINFLDYLHQYRIEHAKQLLGQNYKLYAVARMVGYQEERYFSSKFKKWTGLTPTEFRNRLDISGT